MFVPATARSSQDTHPQLTTTLSAPGLRPRSPFVRSNMTD